jgi:hypothetical protein
MGVISDLIYDPNDTRPGGKITDAIFGPPREPLDIEIPDVVGDSNLPAQGEAGEEAVDEARATEDASDAADIENKERADELAAGIEEDKDATSERFDEAGEGLEEDRARIQEDIDKQTENIQSIPGDVDARFDELRSEFDANAAGAFDRLDSEKSEVLGGIMEGQAQVMQAAVQNTQGNVNTQVAKIMSDPNLSDSQKRSMVAQVRMSGSSALGGIVGTTQLQFNELRANTATKFAEIGGQIQNQILNTQGQLIGMQGQAFAQTQIAVGQMTNTLLEIDANSSAAFANSQAQLLAARSSAEMAGNQLLLDVLPLQDTPFPDHSQSALLQYQIAGDVAMRQFALTLQGMSVEMQDALLASMEGTGLSQLFELALSFVGIGK